MGDKPKKAWYVRWWAIITYVFVFLLILSALTDDGKNEHGQPTKRGQATVKSEPKKLKTKSLAQKFKKQKQSLKKIRPPLLSEYEIVEAKDISHKALTEPLSSYTIQEIKSLPVDKKFSYKVVVPASIKTEQVKPTVKKIISDITRGDSDIDEIILFFYSDKELVNGEYDVARAIWAPGGEIGEITPEIAASNDRSDYRIAIDIKDNLEEYLSNRQKSESKFGLSEEQRKTIFFELVAAEDKASKEADDLYLSDYNKYSELEDKYKAEVRAKYGISEDIADQIIEEGTTDNWPMP